MNLNKVLLVGNLTRDPELKALPSGSKVVSFGIATNRIWYGEDKQKKEEVTFHNVTGFGKMAENIAQYMKKGQSILVEGRMQTRSWDDKDSGKKMYKTEVIIESFQFGPKAGGASNTEKSDYDQINKKEEEIDTIEYPEEKIDASDIPF